MDNKEELSPNDLDNIHVDQEINPHKSTFPEFYIKDGKMMKVKTVEDWLEAYWIAYIGYKNNN